MKETILFDIDRTLLDTGKMVKIINLSMLEHLGIEDAEYDAIFLGYLKGLKRDREFEPEQFIEYLSEKVGFEDKSKLVDVFYGKDNVYEKSLYPETLPVLEILREKYSLGIYSEGTLKFQTHKFKSMGIDKYLEKDLVFIFEEKDSENSISKLPEGCTIVDDKPEVVKILLVYGKFKPVWINRKTKEKDPNVKTIHNLMELS